MAHCVCACVGSVCVRNVLFLIQKVSKGGVS